MEQAINAKYVKYLAVIKASSKNVNGIEMFEYHDCKIYSGFSFDVFRQLLIEEVIALDVRVGVYMSGKNVGKLHDHGYAFRIAKRNLSRAFQIVEL